MKANWKACGVFKLLKPVGDPWTSKNIAADSGNHIYLVCKYQRVREKKGPPDDRSEMKINHRLNISIFLLNRQQIVIFHKIATDRWKVDLLREFKKKNIFSLQPSTSHRVWQKPNAIFTHGLLRDGQKITAQFYDEQLDHLNDALNNKTVLFCSEESRPVILFYIMSLNCDAKFSYMTRVLLRPIN